MQENIPLVNMNLDHPPPQRRKKKGKEKAKHSTIFLNINRIILRVPKILWK
jgi:hypothetical protein